MAQQVTPPFKMCPQCNEKCAMQVTHCPKCGFDFTSVPPQGFASPASAALNSAWPISPTLVQVSLILHSIACLCFILFSLFQVYNYIKVQGEVHDAEVRQQWERNHR